MSHTPQISGFTFIKNGLTLGYPIKESIESISPLCDEVVINVGFDDPNMKSDDGTYEYLQDSFPENKYKFIKNVWDKKLTSNGEILSVQTNLALQECRGKYCQYIQGDETIHQDDLPLIESGIKEMEINENISGLIFKYLHFYGNVDTIKYTRNVYRREVRLIRNFSGIKSWKDAQGFKTADNQKITARQINARIFHYGWARKENIMANKVHSFDKLYHGKDYESEKFQYARIWGLKKFKETHPQVMEKWIAENKNDLDIMSLKLDLKKGDLGLILSDLLESISGYRIGEYKNFKEV